MRNVFGHRLNYSVCLLLVVGVCGCMDGGFTLPIVNLELDGPPDGSGGDPSGEDMPGGGFGEDTGDGADPSDGDGGDDGSIVDSDQPTSDSGAGDNVTSPQNAYCAAVEDWDAGWAEFEQQVVALVNQRRSEGAVCGGTEFPPADPLEVDGSLRCAARNHALDMAVRGFFDHTNPDGDGPGDRIVYAEYEFGGWGENIAFGYPSPQAVVGGWMDSPGHCSNIMNESFTQSGVGFYQGNQWVQVFGTPR